MSQKEKALRFTFADKDSANEAKNCIEKRYPQLLVTVTEHANLVVCSTRSVTFDTRIEEEVINLGGLII
jgi:hypothetical protein